MRKPLPYSCNRVPHWPKRTSFSVKRLINIVLAVIGGLTGQLARFCPRKGPFANHAGFSPSAGGPSVISGRLGGINRNKSLKY